MLLRCLLIVSILGLLACSLTAACTSRPDRSSNPEAAMPGRSIEAVLRDHTDALMDLPGVTGVGQGRCDGQPCIKVFAVEATPALQQHVPDSLEGYPVVLEASGPVRARPGDL